MFVPILVTAVMITTLIRATIRPYSIAVAPALVAKENVKRAGPCARITP